MMLRKKIGKVDVPHFCSDKTDPYLHIKIKCGGPIRYSVFNDVICIYNCLQN